MVTKVVFIVLKAECEAASLAIKLIQYKLLWAECEAASLAIKLIQYKSLWAECGHKSCVPCFKNGVRGDQPRHQPSSRQITLDGVRASKVVFIVSKAGVRGGQQRY